MLKIYGTPLSPFVRKALLALEYKGLAYENEDAPSIADIAVVTCFIRAQYGDYDVDGSRYPKLRRYLDAAYASPLVVNRLESERANLPPGM